MSWKNILKSNNQAFIDNVLGPKFEQKSMGWEVGDNTIELPINSPDIPPMLQSGTIGKFTKQSEYGDISTYTINAEKIDPNWRFTANKEMEDMPEQVPQYWRRG